MIHIGNIRVIENFIRHKDNVRLEGRWFKVELPNLESLPKSEILPKINKAATLLATIFDCKMFYDTRQSNSLFFMEFGAMHMQQCWCLRWFVPAL